MPSEDVISTQNLIKITNLLYPGFVVTYNKPLARSSEKSTEFDDSHRRAASFRRKRNLFSNTVECLADAGFYYCGSGDKVRCYQCGLGLQHLDNEDPLIVHIKLSPYCQHVHQTADADVIAAIQRTSPFAHVNNESPEHLKEDVFVSIKHYLSEEAKRQCKESFELQQAFADQISKFIDNGYFFCKDEQKACCALCNKIVDLQPGTTPTIRHEAWCVYRDNKTDGGL